MSKEFPREQIRSLLAQPPMSPEQVEDFLDRALHPPKKSKRGFAAMSPEKQRELSRAGGKAVQASGKGYKWSSEEAQAAGRKGGKVSSRRKKEERERRRA